MAVLAVAFVVLAAVPAALTDSDAAMQNVPSDAGSVKTELAGDEANTWYYSSNTTVSTVSVTADGVVVLIKEGCAYKFYGSKDVTFYVGQLNGETYQYDPSTKIVIKGDSSTGATTVTAKSDSFTVDLEGSAAVQYGITVAEAGKTVYSPQYAGQMTVKAATHSVSLNMPSQTNVDKQETASFTITYLVDAATNDTPATVSVKVKNSETVNLKFTATGY